MGKAADGRSTIIQRDDGWHGYVSFGTDGATGRRRRKHVRGRSKSDVATKVANLERQREGGYVGGPGTSVANHIDAWVAARSAIVTPNTLHGYVADVRRIKAVLGRVKLAKLTPEHVEALWRSMLAEAYRRAASPIAGAPSPLPCRPPPIGAASPATLSAWR